MLTFKRNPELNMELFKYKLNLHHLDNATSLKAWLGDDSKAFRDLKTDPALFGVV